MSDLKSQLIRLGNANPELRADLKPVIAHLSRKPRVAQGQEDVEAIAQVIKKALEETGESTHKAMWGKFYVYDSPARSFYPLIMGQPAVERKGRVDILTTRMFAKGVVPVEDLFREKKSQMEKRFGPALTTKSVKTRRGPRLRVTFDVMKGSFYLDIAQYLINAALKAKNMKVNVVRREDRLWVRVRHGAEELAAALGSCATVERSYAVSINPKACL